VVDNLRKTPWGSGRVTDFKKSTIWPTTVTFLKSAGIMTFHIVPSIPIVLSVEAFPWKLQVGGCEWHVTAHR